MSPSLTVLKETDHARRVVLEGNFVSGSKLVGVATKLIPKFLFFLSMKLNIIYWTKGKISCPTCKSNNIVIIFLRPNRVHAII